MFGSKKDVGFPIITLPCYDDLVKRTVDLMSSFGLGLSDLKCGFLTNNELIYIIREILYLKNGNACYYVGLLRAPMKHLLVFLVSLLDGTKKTGALISLLFYIIGKDKWITTANLPPETKLEERLVAKHRTAVRERTRLHEMFFELAISLYYPPPKDSRKGTFSFGREPLTFSKLDGPKFGKDESLLCVIKDPFWAVNALLGEKQPEAKRYLHRVATPINHVFPSYVVTDLIKAGGRKATIDDPDGVQFCEVLQSAISAMRAYVLTESDETTRNRLFDMANTAIGTIGVTSSNHQN
jgi:hypothetical protein